MKIKYHISIILLIALSANLTAQSKITIGLFNHNQGSVDNGYILFAPMSDTKTYLIDKCGYLVHKWSSPYRPGLSVFLLPNGKLLRTGRDMSTAFANGGGGGYFEIIDWNNNVEWRYKYSSQNECPHHDIKYMPNGNILALVWEKKTKEDCLIVGKNPQFMGSTLWSEKIMEFRPIGSDSAEIVWEWKLWDHLIQDFDKERASWGDVAAHPELVDVNYGIDNNVVEWQHMNSIDYNPEFNQILISSRNCSEIWVIDHSTSTAQAATHIGGKYGKGGDIIYRWGNPQAYKNGTVQDQQLFMQHNAYWIAKGFPYAGNIMIFNNSHGPVGAKYSTVDIIEPPVDENGFYNSVIPYQPASNVWSYIAPKPTDFNALNLSGAQMLKNGSVLICNGSGGYFFEIDTAKNVVWKYVNPVGLNGVLIQGSNPNLTNNVFRCTFYPVDYPAFAGKDLSRQGLIENENENSAGCTLFTSVKDNNNDELTKIYPTPTDKNLTIITDLLEYNVEIYDIRGELRMNIENANTVNTEKLENGIYFIKITSKDKLSNSYYKAVVWR